MMKISDKSYREQFLDTFLRLAYKYGKWRIWSDYIYFHASSLSNLFDGECRKQRESEYLKRIEIYSPAELQLLASLAGLVTLALDENPEQDFLGSIYEGNLEMTDPKVGQVYTPYHIAQTMAVVVDEQEILKSNPYICAWDPCCGYGVLSIAYTSELRKAGINYQEKVLFILQDIDSTSALGSYIQLSLLGCAAEVRIGNVLEDNAIGTENTWHSPMYFDEGWIKQRRLADFIGVTKCLMAA